MNHFLDHIHSHFLFSQGQDNINIFGFGCSDGNYIEDTRKKSRMHFKIYMSNAGEQINIVIPASTLKRKTKQVLPPF